MNTEMTTAVNPVKAVIETAIVKTQPLLKQVGVFHRKNRKVAVGVDVAAFIVLFILYVNFPIPVLILLVAGIALCVAAGLRNRKGALSASSIVNVATLAHTDNTVSLEEASRSEDVELRRGVAANPATPAQTLHTLLNSDEDDEVRNLVALNPSTPMDVLHYFVAHCELDSDGDIPSSLSKEEADALSDLRFDNEETVSLIAGRDDLSDELVETLERRGAFED